MSDAEKAAVEGATVDNKSDFTPITTQEEFNERLADRLKRATEKFADYNDLKTKASEFDKLADAQKSETQKAIERAELAESALKSQASETLRLSVIARLNIPADYQEFVTGSTEEELVAKAEKVLSLIPTPAEPEQPARRELFVGSEGRSASTALNSDALLDSLRAAVGG